MFLFVLGTSLERFELPSLNPINVSHSFFVLSLLAISCLLQKFNSGIRCILMAVVCSFGVSMATYAGSRGALLAFICSLVVVFLVSSFSKLWALIPVLFSILLLAQHDPSGLVSRLTVSGSDLNSIFRLSAIQESIKVFLANPLLGNGFGYHISLSDSVGYSHMWYPHNFVFESLALGGLVLTIPLFACILLSVRSCINFMTYSSTIEVWHIALLIQAFGYVTFSGHLANVPMFWVALGLASSRPPAFAKT